MTKQNSLISRVEYGDDQRYGSSVPLLAGLVGGGLAVLVSKVFDLLASGLAGHGYQLAFHDRIFTAIFIGLLLTALFIARPRPEGTRSLADENHRRIEELLDRLEKLKQANKR